MLKDDLEHPIPSLALVDVLTLKSDGGADLFLIVASPLLGDTYSLERIQAKIQGYLQHINSDDFRQQAPSANHCNTKLIVKFHPNSATEAVKLVERCASWVNSNGATLVVQSLSKEEQGLE